MPSGGWWAGTLLLSLLCSGTVAARPKVLILGGTGRIGSACATHILRARCAPIEVIIGGRSHRRAQAALQEIAADARLDKGSSELRFEQCDWTDPDSLSRAIAGVDAVIHTAGPFGEQPMVLRACIDAKTPVYVDLSDPLPYIRAAKAMAADAHAAGTCALICAGAFPGLSNVLAMEAASLLPPGEAVGDIDFSYFTAGLGGSGKINLYITNEGFGTPVPTYREGVLDPSLEAGDQPRKVDFFLDDDDPSAKLVGTRTVWSWPFPEAATVASELSIAGSSSVGMGTAPELWNWIMTLMVRSLPRTIWRSQLFCHSLALFSLPLVSITDRYVGETHAMRIDLTGAKGSRIAAVQAHRSFRRIVGQSAAEFALAMIRHPVSHGLEAAAAANPAGALAAELLPIPPGVWTPEELARDPNERRSLLARMLRVEGTLNFGVRVLEYAPGTPPKRPLAVSNI